MPSTHIARFGPPAVDRVAARNGRKAIALSVASMLLAACTGGGATPTPITTATPAASSPVATPAATHEGRVVVYSGRSQSLVDPILQQFETATGIKTEIRYAGTSELAVTILEEGANSPADVYFSQDAGALGAVAAAGRLTELPADLLAMVDPRFQSKTGLWVGVSGRARVLAYDSRELKPENLPTKVADLTSPTWKGRIGWVPTNASFQTFVTALRRTIGDTATVDWLKAMKANEPRVYDGNAAALQAVASGEIDAALINHYYLFQAQAQSSDPLPVANHYFSDGDPGALVNLAGAAILSSAPHPVAAEQLVRYLLGVEAQHYFSDKTFEYPLVTGIAADSRLPALAQIQSPDYDLSDLADLEGSLRLLQEAGVL